jgi:hypothetical protein
MIELGKVIVHDNAEMELRRCNQRVDEFLNKFSSADFGDIDAETRAFNEAALKDGGDVLGVYELCSGLPLWVIGDGKQTDVVLP